MVCDKIPLIAKDFIKVDLPEALDPVSKVQLSAVMELGTGLLIRG
jgi:hypothetical protein